MIGGTARGKIHEQLVVTCIVLVLFVRLVMVVLFLFVVDGDAEGTGIEGDGVVTEEAFDVFSGDHFAGGEMVEERVVDEGDGIAKGEGDVQFVSGEEDAFAPLVGEAAQEDAQFVAIGEVEEGGGFVEEDDGGVLRQGTGNHHALAFAVGYTVDGGVGKGREVE